MRLTIIAFCCALILCSSFSGEKQESAEIIITALRFDKERAAALRNAPEQSAFTVDKNDILRPAKDYQIIYGKTDKVLVLLPTATSYSAYKKINGYEEIELSDGSLVGCMCDGAIDNCRFDNSKKDYKFVCTGSCRCYIGVLFNIDPPPLEYETPGGSWFNF